MGFYPERVAVPSLLWLGVLPKDLLHLNIPEQVAEFSYICPAGCARASFLLRLCRARASACWNCSQTFVCIAFLFCAVAGHPASQDST